MNYAAVLVALPPADRHDLCATTGKVRHRTHSKAFLVAQSMNRKHKNRVHGRSEHIHCFRCESCGGWHTGHNVKGKAA